MGFALGCAMNESYDKYRGLGTLSPEGVEAICDELLRVGEPRAAVQILQSLDLLPEPVRSESRRSLACMVQIIPRPIVSTKYDDAVEALMNGAEKDLIIEADNFIADIFSEIRSLFDLAGTGGWIEPADCSEIDARSIVLCCELLPGTIEDLEVVVSDVRPLTLRNRLLSKLDAFAKVARTSAPYFPPKEITGRVIRRHRGKDECQRLNKAKASNKIANNKAINDAINTVLDARRREDADQTMTEREILEVQTMIAKAEGASREVLKGPVKDWPCPSRSTLQRHAKQVFKDRLAIADRGGG